MEVFTAYFFVLAILSFAGMLIFHFMEARAENIEYEMRAKRHLDECRIEWEKRQNQERDNGR